MIYHVQFVDWKKTPLEESHPELFVSEPGFTGEHVPSVSELIRRLSAGMPVPMFNDGEDVSDQLFDSEIPERFDVLDQTEYYKRQFGDNKPNQETGKDKDHS